MTDSNLRLQDILERLQGVKQSGSGYMALCPCHDDHNPSLSVTEEDGNILAHCFAGCPQESVQKALGLYRPDDRGLAAQSRQKRIVAAYDYTDESRNLLFQKVRYEPKDFRCRVKNSNGGWSWKMNGVRRVLYNLPAVIESSVIFVCEGEKDCDLLVWHGFAATCNYDGAGKWSPDYNQYFRNKVVYILPDNDDPGRKHAANVFHQIRDIAAKCRIVKLPALPDKGDVSDFFVSGGTVEQFNDVVMNTLEGLPERFFDELSVKTKLSKREPVLISLADVEKKPVEWLWQDRFALGKLSALGGDCDLGKSFIALNIAATISRGLPLPGEYNPYREPAGSIILTAEDGLEDTIRPRLDAMDADCARIVALRGTKLDDREQEFDLLSDVEQLRTAITQVPSCQLIIIDPVSSYLGGIDTHRDAAVRSALRPLAEMADEMNVAVICISHLNKNSGGNAKYRITGSVAFTAFGRSAWMVCEDQDDRTGQRRFMLPIKNNLTEAKKNGLAYQIINNALQWETDPVEMSAQDYISQHSPGPDPVERTEAEQFLREVLADGPLNADEVHKQAKVNGISKTTLRRAKDALGIKPRKIGYGKESAWRWSLIEEDTQDDTVYPEHL